MVSLSPLQLVFLPEKDHFLSNPTSFLHVEFWEVISGCSRGALCNSTHNPAMIPSQAGRVFRRKISKMGLRAQFSAPSILLMELLLPKVWNLLEITLAVLPNP